MTSYLLIIIITHQTFLNRRCLLFLHASPMRQIVSLAGRVLGGAARCSRAQRRMLALFLLALTMAAMQWLRDRRRRLWLQHRLGICAAAVVAMGRRDADGDGAEREEEEEEEQEEVVFAAERATRATAAEAATASEEGSSSPTAAVAGAAAAAEEAEEEAIGYAEAADSDTFEVKRREIRSRDSNDHDMACSIDSSTDLASSLAADTMRTLVTPTRLQDSEPLFFTCC